MRTRRRNALPPHGQLHSSDMFNPPAEDDELRGSVLTHFIIKRSPAVQEIVCVEAQVLGLAEVAQVSAVSTNEAGVAPLAGECISVNVCVFAPLGVPKWIARNVADVHAFAKRFGAGEEMVVNDPPNPVR